MDPELIKHLILGSYVFTSASFAFTFTLYKWLLGDVRKLETNHLKHIEEAVETLKLEVAEACKMKDCPFKDAKE